MARYSMSDKITDAGMMPCGAVVDAHLPPTIAIARDGTLHFAHGYLKPHLNLLPGRPLPAVSARLNNSALSPSALAALNRCRLKGETIVTFEGAQHARLGQQHTKPKKLCTRITARPAFEIADGVVVVTFEPVDEAAAYAHLVAHGTVSAVDKTGKLEEELDATRQKLHETQRRLDTVNQDLRASHDEALVMNEELQLSNRELENTTAELRSLNRRLEEKIEQLKEAHDDLVNFFASTEMATLFLDENLCVKRFTPIVEDMLGITHNDRGRYVGDIDHELLQNRLVDDARAVLNERSPRWRNVRTSNGVWVTRRVLPYRAEDLSVEGVVVTLVDITDLKKIEGALRESETRFREMADGLPQAVWVHGPHGEQQLVNETSCEFFGVSRKEMKGSRWRTLLHPDDLDTYTQQFQACMAERRPFHAQARLKRADGEWRWLESWGKPRFTETGEFKGFVVSSTDVTEQKSTEAALRESEQRFRTLADNIAQLAWMADKEGHMFWFNQRWFDYTGTSPEEMQRTGWQQIPHPDHLERVRSKYERCIKTGEPWEDTFPMRGKNGEYRWFLSRALPTRDESSEIVRWLGTNTDITEQREVELLLRESDQRKDEYLAMLGHELRNPLAGITAATQLARVTQTDDPRLQHAISVLERQSSHVTQIVDGLLEVSRIARGKIELECTPLNIVEVLRGVLQDRIPHLVKRGLKLEQRYPEKPLCVSGDWVRLVQVFDNLLGNAIKFTQSPGTVIVTAWESEGNALISIRDTGVGIRREMLTQIFEPFLQEIQDVARAAGGLGLGLSLAKSLVELHHGSIEARSEGSGRGAEFLVRLPLTSRAENGAAAPHEDSADHKRILIVEDNADAADTLGSLLEVKGHAVHIARTAPEGLEFLQHEEVDVILCDIGLPGMNGYDFAHAVRADEELRDIMLVAITGYGQPEDRKRSMEAGFDQHLTKPVGMDALEKVLNGKS